MNQLLEWFSKFFSSWKFWVVISPWDVGVRVRLGKNAVALSPGPHFRMPIIDNIAIVNTRLRITTTPPATVQGNGNGKSKVVSVTIGYKISAPILAMLHFEHPSIAIQSYAQALIAKLSDVDVCLNELRLYFRSTGIEIEFVKFVTNVEVFTVKLLQNERDITSEGYFTNSQTSGDPRY